MHVGEKGEQDGETRASTGTGTFQSSVIPSFSRHLDCWNHGHGCAGGVWITVTGIPDDRSRLEAGDDGSASRDANSVVREYDDYGGSYAHDRTAEGCRRGTSRSNDHDVVP